MNLGCGDVSPDGKRIVVEGFSTTGTTSNGIYSVRASDGGDLLRLTRGTDGYPQYSPDGAEIVFTRTKPGVQPPGAGAIFVVTASGEKATRITPWGASFLRPSWSPDGRWIAYEHPFGELYLIRPDGTDDHPVPVELPRGSGASEPSWSPDGSWLVFSLREDGGEMIYAVRPDGTSLQSITTFSRGDEHSLPGWAP